MQICLLKQINHLFLLAESTSQTSLQSRGESPDIPHLDLSLRPPSPSSSYSRIPHSPADPEPPFKPSDYVVLGYGLSQLGLIRLIPKRYPDERFEFRKYTFGRNHKDIVRLIGDHEYGPMPCEPQLALTRFDGEIYAILGDSGILSGLYFISQQHFRLKLNIRTGRTRALDAKDKELVPVGARRKIKNHFSVVVTNQDTLQTGQ